MANIIGTIAGDDTVLVVSKSASGGAQLENQLREFLRVTQPKGRKVAK
jgi:arginine repressor